MRGAPAPCFAAPRPGGPSLWHHVDLRAQDWLDEEEEAGLLHYVNEIPQGALQKFELHSDLPLNEIREDTKGSKRLRAFGVPVPFNYGCFPQTWRDPERRDAISCLGGDNDPLDVVDLSLASVGVGEVVRCRLLGAVCLVDEGQADWKVLVVNVEAGGPLSQARSVEEVERLAPGRVAAALRWMDDLKRHGGDADTHLDFTVHGAEVARSLVDQDHASYRRLVAEAGRGGTARGHWIHEAREPAPRPTPAPLRRGWWPEGAVPGLPLPVPTFAGVAAPRSSVPLALAASARSSGAPGR